MNFHLIHIFFLKDNAIPGMQHRFFGLIIVLIPIKCQVEHAVDNSVGCHLYKKFLYIK